MNVIYHDRSNYQGIDAKLNRAYFITAYKPSNAWVGDLINSFRGTPKVQAAPAPTNKVVNTNTSNSLNGWGNTSSFAPQTTKTVTKSGGSYNTPSQATNNGSNQAYDMINQQQEAGNQQIDADYESAMGMLSGAEQGLQSQAGVANQTIDQQMGATKNEIQNTQGTAEAATNKSLQTAEAEGRSAMQQARDVYGQVQQRNNAQLSALGISSSSVNEALAERLGVETARRIAGVTGGLGEARQNAVDELGRIKTYYQGKIEDMTRQSAIQKATIQNSLIQGLNQINQARGQAASDKAQARSSLLAQVQNQIYSLTQQQQQFQQSLQQWASTKTSALTPIANGEFEKELASKVAYFNQDPNISQSNLVAYPTVNYNSSGAPTSGNITFKSTKTPEDEDPYNAILKQALGN
jgi:hypothetical protein